MRFGIVDRLTDYRSCYGYPADIALIAEFWWRVEHLGDRRWIIRKLVYYFDWSPFRRVRRVGYAQRKRWERIGHDQKLRREYYEAAGQKPVM